MLANSSKKKKSHCEVGTKIMVQVKPGTYALSPKINGMTLTEFDNYLILKAKKNIPVF